MDIDKDLQKARKSLNDFCFTECSAYCCRKGYLRLTSKELEAVTKGKNLKKDDINSKDGKFTMFLGNKCPALSEDMKCTIHKMKLRSKACKEFPIFREKNTIILSGRCLAVKQQYFYKFVSKWKKQGYNIIISNSYEGYDLTNNIVP